MNIIYSTPGKYIDIILHVYDNGELSDSLTTPIIKSIYNPNLNLIDGYPQDMNHLDTGVYQFKYLIINNPASLGNFVVDVEYTHPNNFVLNNIYQIIVRMSNSLSNNYYAIVKNL